MGPLFQNKYRIETARYFKSDYNIGYFFVTFCTKKREHFLGEIKNQEMHFSKIGEYACDVIRKAPDLHSCCGIDAFVVMPNHVHLIVIMDNTDGRLPQCERLPQCDSPTTPDDNGNPEDWVVGLPYHDSRIDDNPEINEEMQRRAYCCGRLSHIIGQFKSAVTKYANAHDIPFMWQPRYHDHIIRNQLEMNRIADYIQNNPMKWELDKFYKKK